MTGSRWGAVAAAGLIGTLLTAAPGDAAGLWTVGAAAGSASQAHSGALTTTTVTLHCAAANSNSVNVNWTAVAHAASYTVYYATAANGPYSVAGSGITGTSFTASGNPGNSYWVQVQAINGAWTTTSPHAGPVVIGTGPTCSP